MANLTQQPESRDTTSSSLPVVEQLRKLCHVMDEAIQIPGTNLSFGLDSLIGLVPGLGDAATTIVSAYIVHRAKQLGVPRVVRGRMIVNIAVDAIVGAVPLVGDLFDFGWKANVKNLRLLENSLEELAASRKH